MATKPTVLIADDDARNIFALKAVLLLKGFRVLTAHDGRECISLLNQTPEVDVVLMDMMMPELDGYDAIRMLRSEPQFRHLPIIAVTAQAMTGDREKCLEAGASDYISKPIDDEQLVALLHQYTNS